LKETITLSIEKQLRTKIDEKRGDIPRSRFVSNLLEACLGIWISQSDSQIGILLQ